MRLFHAVAWAVASVRFGFVVEPTAFGGIFTWRSLQSIFALTGGVGWDADNPLRPWPWWSSKPQGHLIDRYAAVPWYHCVSFCGLWVGWERRFDPLKPHLVDQWHVWRSRRAGKGV